MKGTRPPYLPGQPPPLIKGGRGGFKRTAGQCRGCRVNPPYPPFGKGGNGGPGKRYTCLSEYRLREVVRRLRAGQIIAYPTEAVFGLGCDPCNATAVRRLLAIKRRPVSKGLILIAATLAQLEPFLEPLAAVFRARLEATWPGPLTWLVPARQAPGWLRGTHATLAVRVTAHPLAAALCRAWGGPLVSTSANRGGRPPARSALAVRRRLGNRVDYIVPGAVGGARQPTEIHDLRSGQVVRAG